MNELIELFSKKDPSNEDKRTKLGVTMLFFLILSAVLLFLLGKTLLPILTLVVALVYLGLFLNNALRDPEWLKGETYD